MLDARLLVGCEPPYSDLPILRPTFAPKHHILKSARLDTELGPMIAMADEAGLYLLEFMDCRGLAREIDQLRKKLNATVIPGNNDILQQIASEISDFFAGKKRVFHTSLHPMGSPFQLKVWQELQKIPFGETRSYRDIAKQIGQPTACRAVARANSMNQIAIVIPCHRVINTNGDLGGYAGGVSKKKWLLSHEKN